MKPFADRHAMRPGVPVRLRSRARARCLLLAFSVAALLPTACDDTFTPLAAPSVDYSIFGYLDPSADTQWIRVMPIRSVVPTTPDLPGATVTLENLATGHIIELRDSLQRYTNYLHPEIGSDGVFVHNFWTTERIEPGATYRFIAQRAGEAPAEALVVIPNEYAVELLVSNFAPPSDRLRIEGLKHVAFVRTLAHYHDTCGADVHRVTFRDIRREGDAYTLVLRNNPVPPRGPCGTPGLDRLEVWTAGSEAEWPSGIEHATSGIGVPEEVTNISNAVGFIGGVYTKLIPYGECSFTGGTAAPQYCPLRYDAASAWLTGTVMETRCGDGPMPGVTVTLRELDGEPVAQRRIRTARTTLAGRFEIGALEAGMRYAVEVRGNANVHTIHTDTLAFTPGERKRYDVGLTRVTPCSQKPNP